MSYTRAQLYALGEPFGDSCTCVDGGRRIYGGGSSKSSSSSSSTTNNTDKRIAVETGIGISSDGSNITVEALDGDIVTKALDTVKAADATAGAGFQQLLTLADKLFTGAGQVVETTQATTLEQIKSINTAQNDSKGAIDQKTIIVLGIAGAVAYAATRKKG